MILYIKLTSPFRIINKVIERLGLIKHNWVKFAKYNLVYLFTVKIPAKVKWFYYLYLTG